MLCDRPVNWPPAVSEPLAPSVMLNRPGALNEDVLLALKLSLTRTAVDVSMNWFGPGRSVGVPAPCVLVASAWKVWVIVEPTALVHVPDPDELIVFTGPTKSVPPTASV